MLIKKLRKVATVTVAVAMVFCGTGNLMATEKPVEDKKPATSKTEVREGAIRIKAGGQQLYQVRESPSGPVIFTGNATAVEAYNEDNYSECDGSAVNCTYVYYQGTTVRNTALERYHDN